MQSKVSIVVPCYNKERYIGAMLQSVISQIWDNIELILVNDGSTDGTRAVIDEYAPRIRDRGYELVLVDQENQGVASAVKDGLLRVSGDYVCTIDCDDEILPEYVSAMAGFLEEHREYEWAASDLGWCSDPATGKMVPVAPSFPAQRDQERLTENYILKRLLTQAGHYLVRKTYLDQCKVVERFDTTRGTNQEPKVVLPLAEGGGKLWWNPRVLYKYNVYAVGYSRQYEIVGAMQHAKNRSTGYRRTVESLDVTELRRTYLLGLCDIIEMIYANGLTRNLGEKGEWSEAAEAVAATADRLLAPAPGLTGEEVLRAGIPAVIAVLETAAMGLKNPFLDELPAAKRVIGYGALGRAAWELLPSFAGTRLEPAVLWDTGAPGVAVNGREVLLPDLDSLSPDDLVLLFPQNAEVMADMIPLFEVTGCRVLRYWEIADYLAAEHFRGILTESKFVPKGDA